MKKRIVAVAAVAAALGASGAWAQRAPAPETVPQPGVREYQGVHYLTGGIGEEERAEILGQAREFNLKLVFAEKSGDYLSDVRVVVATPGGRKVLEATADGPWFFAKLPPGEYRVTVSANGQEQTHSAVVPATGQRELSFYW